MSGGNGRAGTTGGGNRGGRGPPADGGRARGCLVGVPTDDEDLTGPTAPAIPSFDSLRGPRRRSPVDVLVPVERPAPPRPPEWSDLWLLGLHVAERVLAAQVRVVRRLLGG